MPRRLVTVLALLLVGGVVAFLLTRESGETPAGTRTTATAEDSSARPMLEGAPGAGSPPPEPPEESPPVPVAPMPPAPAGGNACGACGEAQIPPMELIEEPAPVGTLVLAGSVLDEEARGIEGAKVWLDLREEMAGGAWSTRYEFRDVLTDAAGRFRIADLPAGHYDLHAKAPGTEELGRELEIVADTETSLRLRPGHDVRIRVVPPEGWPPSDTDVWLTPKGGEQRMLQTVEDGVLVAQALPVGTYEVFFRNATRVDWAKGGGDALVTDRRRTIDVHADTRELVLSFEPDQDVGLRVLLPEGFTVVDGVATVVSGAGRAWGKLEFRATRAADGTTTTKVGGPPSTAFPTTRETTAEGLPWLRPLPKGPARVDVEAVGFETVVSHFDVTGPRTLEVALTRSEGRVVEAEVPEAATLYWQVDVRASAADAPWRPRLLWHDARVMITHTPTPGVRRAYLPPGTYVFRLVSDSSAPATAGPITIADDATPLAIPFSPSRGAVLSGKARTKAGGPAREALLHVFLVTDVGPVRMPEKETTPSDGAWLVRGLSPGRYRISLSASGSPALAEATVTTSDTALDLLID